jgi:23S rRNA (guanosine2251-2'-O)-methyltransferase
MYLYGYHACLHALSNPRRQIIQVFVCDELDGIDLSRHKVTKLSKKELEQLIPPNSVHQNIVVKVAPLASYGMDFLKDKTGCVVVLDQVTDPHNIGAIFRSACVFNALAVIVLQRNMPKETATLVKAASGAFDIIPFISVVNLSQAIQELKDFGFWTVGLLESGESSICDLDLTGKIALILGSEGKGIRSLTKKNCDFLSYIPTNENFSALNVSVAASISLFEVFRQNR